MRFRQFGKTGLLLSEIALGGHEFLQNGRSRGFNEDFANAVTAGYLLDGFGGPQRKEVLVAAYDLGINFYDVTIDSEKEALGRNLAEIPPPYPIHIMTRPEGMCYSYDPGNRKMLDYAVLKAEVQRTLSLIRRDAIDLFNIGLINWSIDETPDYMARLADNLRKLRTEGLIRFAVADSHAGQRLYLAEMASGAFDAINLDLSFGEPAGLKKVIPIARDLGMGVIAREVFFKGELFDIADGIGLTDRGRVARAALAWVAGYQPDVVILGVDNADQLRANARTLAEESDSTNREIIALIEACEEFKAYESKRTSQFFEQG
jgi:aryl-alcohol dehydrogenase-like predicted oxidoreductase